MLPLIYSNITYALLFWLSFLASSASELLGPARRRGSRPELKSQDRGSLIVLNCSAVLGMILYFVSPLLFTTTTITWNQPLLFGIGFLLLCLGMSLRWYAMVTLGRFFVGVVLVQVDQHVVQYGPYRYIRHPAYSGILLGAVGMGFMIGNWVSCASITVGLLAGLLYRIKVEEEALRQLVPGYEEYIQQSYKLIPFVF
jgi:protein-S-isoprenylcysteine O-methyltransferase Ste14